MFSFKYSSRPNTPAAERGDAVEEEEKGRRLAELQELQRQIQLRRNQALLGEIFEVLGGRIPAPAWAKRWAEAPPIAS